MGGFSNPILGGAATLIRAAIQSANYVAGSTGWVIGRDGSFDVNSGTFRGSVNIGGVVLLNSAGLHIEKVGGSSQYDINVNAGFLTRNVPDNGQYTQMYPQSFSSEPQNPTPINGYTVSSGKFYTQLVGSTETPLTNVTSPGYGSNHTAVLGLYGQDFASATDNSKVSLTASTVTVRGGDIGGGWVGGGELTSASPAIGATETLVFSTNIIGFTAGRAYKCEFRGDFTASVANSRPLFHMRESSNGVSITGTQLRATGKPNTLASSQTNGDFDAKFVCTGSNVSTYIALTVMGSASFTATVLANAYMDVYDIGVASNFTGYPAL